MEISLTPFDGLKVIQLKIYNDNRGFFVERFNKKLFQDLGFENQHTNGEVQHGIRFFGEALPDCVLRYSG